MHNTESRQEKGDEVLRYALPHVTPSAISFCLKSKLIVFQTGEICNSNFLNRIEVVKNAENLVRRGIVICVLCHKLLQVHGSYPRKLKDEEGKQMSGWIVQLRCDKCKKYPALTPDFIMPYKRYIAYVIENVITEFENGEKIDNIGGCTADIATMQGWIRQFEERGTSAVGWLISILFNLCERHISLLAFHNRTLLKQLARLLLEFSLPKTGKIIGRANIILTTQNCGFL